MTTVERDHAFVLYCGGKSCLQLYLLACQENNIRPNSALLRELPSKPDYFMMHTLDVSGNYLGPVGVHCLLDVLRATTSLVKLDVSKQNADDQTVQAVREALRHHNRLRDVSFADNPEITHESTATIFSWMFLNRSLVSVNCRGTSIAACVQRKLDAIGRANAELEAEFFNGDFVRMKRTFIELDVEGRGKIRVGSLLSQLELPYVAAALEKRFAAVDAGLTADEHIDVAQFLRFTYSNFIDPEMITAHMAREDRDEEFIISNRALLRDELRRRRVECRGLHLVRIFHRVMSRDDSASLAERSIKHMWPHDGVVDSQTTAASGSMELSSLSMKMAVDELFGPEMTFILAERHREWAPLKLTPHFVRLMFAAFVKAAPGCNGSMFHAGTSNLVDAPLGDLLDAGVQSQTMYLDTRIIAAKLLKGDIGRSIGVSFPEWVTFVNECSAAAIYPI